MLINKVLLLMTNRKNLNDRIYPKEVVEAAIQHLSIQEQLKTGGVYGTLGMTDKLLIDVKDISHVVKKFYFGEDNNLYGDVEILDTPKGKILKELLLNGAHLELALRGIGNNIMTENDEYKITDFEIISFDYVEASSNHPFKEYS